MGKEFSFFNNSLRLQQLHWRAITQGYLERVMHFSMPRDGARKGPNARRRTEATQRKESLRSDNEAGGPFPDHPSHRHGIGPSAASQLLEVPAHRDRSIPCS